MIQPVAELVPALSLWLVRKNPAQPDVIKSETYICTISIVKIRNIARVVERIRELAKGGDLKPGESVALLGRSGRPVARGYVMNDGRIGLLPAPGREGAFERLSEMTRRKEAQPLRGLKGPEINRDEFKLERTAPGIATAAPREPRAATARERLAQLAQEKREARELAPEPARKSAIKIDLRAARDAVKIERAPAAEPRAAEKESRTALAAATLVKAAGSELSALDGPAIARAIIKEQIKSSVEKLAKPESDAERAERRADAERERARIEAELRVARENALRNGNTAVAIERAPAAAELERSRTRPAVASALSAAVIMTGATPATALSAAAITTGIPQARDLTQFRTERAIDTLSDGLAAQGVDGKFELELLNDLRAGKNPDPLVMKLYGDALKGKLTSSRIPLAPLGLDVRNSAAATAAPVKEALAIAA